MDGEIVGGVAPHAVLVRRESPPRFRSAMALLATLIWRANALEREDPDTTIGESDYTR